MEMLLDVSMRIKIIIRSSVAFTEEVVRIEKPWKVSRVVVNLTISYFSFELVD